MGMNIKSEDTHRQAKELARIAGETIAEAVDRAVTERLERLRRRRNRKAVTERLVKLGDQCSRLPVVDSRAPDEMLYDEHGRRDDCRRYVGAHRPSPIESPTRPVTLKPSPRRIHR
jgi:hypothetical protein